MRGYLLALGAYVGWGLFPLYWKQLAHVAPEEVLVHRLLWSLPFVAIVILLSRNWPLVVNVLRKKRQVGFLTLSAILISINWGVYIWAVANNQVVGASMGYFLTPLLHVLLGLLVFDERLNRGQWLAVALAFAGVTWQIVRLGELPWVGLTVGFSFALYGMLRKKVAADSATGLFIETLLLFPFGLGLVFWWHRQGTGSFLHIDTSTDLLLILGGAVTAIPLLLFAAGARRLPLATMGLLFYLTPTMQFLIGVLVYDEPLERARLYGFALIWAGLLVYTFSLRQRPGLAAAQR
ncbi:MAG: EamA family transporter RarD [Pseudomonadota bacterium]|nr:EamA family transporter RarD [Pseudomonadota bacterium]